MCGIVAYLGEKVAQPILVEGLKRLEYRGYDSAGVALLDSGAIRIKKTSGRISALEEILDEPDSEERLGIGHTRWATHGEPNTTNAHPHLDYTGKIALVHNGIVENYSTLKRWLENEGVGFVSETDTEVIANLIGYFYAKGDEGRVARDPSPVPLDSNDERRTTSDGLNGQFSRLLVSCTALSAWLLFAQIFPTCSSARKRAAP